MTGAEVLRRKGKSFYWAGQLLSGPQLERAAELYQLCRKIDDLADEATTPAQVETADYKLGELHQALITRLGPTPSSSPLYQQAEGLLGSDPVAMDALADLVQTARQDLGAVRVGDRDELIRYCYGVAGTVGIMMTCLLGARDREQALPHAVDLGIAMQLTNIARDVLEDAYLDRVYLPAGGPAGALAPEKIVAGDEPARHRAWLGVCDLLDTAESYYFSGWRGLEYLPFRARLAIAVAARVYRAIGKRILQRGEKDYWQNRCVVGPMQKFRESVVALAALAFGRFTRSARNSDEPAAG